MTKDSQLITVNEAAKTAFIDFAEVAIAEVTRIEGRERIALILKTGQNIVFNDIKLAAVVIEQFDKFMGIVDAPKTSSLAL